MSKGLFKTNFKHSPIVVLYAHHIFRTSHDLMIHAIGKLQYSEKVAFIKIKKRTKTTKQQQQNKRGHSKASCLFPT